MDDEQKPRRIVLKVGTSTLTYPNGKLNIGCIEQLVRIVSDLHNRGIELVLVSSGAIGVGVSKLGLKHRPKTTRMKQAAAAVGQCELMHIYDKIFLEYGVTVAQVLLTRGDVAGTAQRRNIRNTFDALLECGTVPIVNENDTVAIEEIEQVEHFGDNDTLSAVVARLCNADTLVIFTDIEGLYSENPRTNPDAQLIAKVERIDENLRKIAGGPGTEGGTGGMATKLVAAELCLDANIKMIICKGEDANILYEIVDEKPVGTLFQRRKGGTHA